MNLIMKLLSGMQICSQTMSITQQHKNSNQLWHNNHIHFVSNFWIGFLCRMFLSWGWFPWNPVKKDDSLSSILYFQNLYAVKDKLRIIGPPHKLCQEAILWNRAASNSRQEKALSSCVLIRNKTLTPRLGPHDNIWISFQFGTLPL